jgi:hypothetical protein
VYDDVFGVLISPVSFQLSKETTETAIAPSTRRFYLHPNVGALPPSARAFLLRIFPKKEKRKPKMQREG